MVKEWNEEWIREIEESKISSILENLTILKNIFIEKTN